MQIPTFRWIILVKTPFLSLTLSPHDSFHQLGVFSNYLGIFSLFKSTVENQVLSSQVMRQLPSTQCLGGIKPARGPTPES